MITLVFLFTATTVMGETLLVKWHCEQPRAASDEETEWQNLSMTTKKIVPSPL